MPPLTSKRVLITRTRHQASDLAAQLEALGATAILIPAIEIIPPASYAALDAALAELPTFDWLLFTSVNAVEVFQQRRNPALTPRRIAAIGPATARAIESTGLHVDLIPPQYVAESLAAALIPFAPGAKMLLLRAAAARDYLPEALIAAGAHVLVAEAYRNQIPPDSIAALQALFARPATFPDAVTFTSASTATNLFTLLEAASLTLPPAITLASIGPITSQTLRELGYPPTTEAVAPTIPALIQALLSTL